VILILSKIHETFYIWSIPHPVFALKLFKASAAPDEGNRTKKIKYKGENKI
jgi:hypothetical protein